MVFFLIILLLIIFNGLSFCGAGEFNGDYLNKRNTTAINGIFVILVVFSHYAQYAPFGGVFDEPYLALREHLNQLVVATFWFYSGYGMMEAIRRTEGGYVSKLPVKFWQLMLRFDVAVLIFWVMNAALGTVFPLKTLLLSLPGWGTVGNSNWYIFAMLVEYILMYAAFRLGSVISSKRGRLAGLILMFVLTIAFVFVLMKAGRPGYTYNTVIILPFGAFWSEFRDKIEKFVMKSDVSYVFCFTAALGIYVVSFFKRWSFGIEGYTVWAIMFTVLLVMVTMKISIYNPLLEWFGKHIFSIYILQRIPMTLLARFGCIDNHKYISLIVVFATTMLIALLFEKFTDRVIAAINNGIGKKEIKPAA
ncbi:MAG: acyltransferase [Clostridiales bacterium]|nr:acyltransferase [Clostridiales bacterium]